MVRVNFNIVMVNFNTARDNFNMVIVRDKDRDREWRLDLDQALSLPAEAAPTL
jgi:hypothetical protein